jgi:hypothetical protein
MKNSHSYSEYAVIEFSTGPVAHGQRKLVGPVKILRKI